MALALTLAAPAPAVVESPVPAAFAARVAAAVAERWHVASDAIVLAWDGAPREAPEADAAFQLAGAGVDGRFAVVLRPGTLASEALRLRAGVPDRVAVAARALAPGQRLGPGDWSLEARTTWGAPRTTSRPADGWDVRRAIAAGEPLAWPSVAPPRLIQGGDRLTLVWERDQVRITATGVALQGGARGESIRARVDGSGARVMATAVAPGIATLSLEPAGGAR